MQPWHEIDGLKAIERSLSNERFARYVRHAKGDRLAALLLYESNTLLSEALYPVIQGLEITLRNAYNRTLARIYRADWYDNFNGWGNHEREKIEKAQAEIRKSGGSVVPGKVVAELSFGFWVGLSKKEYGWNLWRYLQLAFNPSRPDYKMVHQRLTEIQKLRNRIAHHECVLPRDLELDYARTVETIRWICPMTADWVQNSNRFSAVYKDRSESLVLGTMPGDTLGSMIRGASQKATQIRQRVATLRQQEEVAGKEPGTSS